MTKQRQQAGDELLFKGIRSVHEFQSLAAKTSKSESPFSFKPEATTNKPWADDTRDHTN